MLEDKAMRNYTFKHGLGIQLGDFSQWRWRRLHPFLPILVPSFQCTITPLPPWYHTAPETKIFKSKSLFTFLYCDITWFSPPCGGVLVGKVRGQGHYRRENLASSLVMPLSKGITPACKDDAEIFFFLWGSRCAENGRTCPQYRRSCQGTEEPIWRTK